MKTPPVIKSAEEVLAELATQCPQVEVEQDRRWLWILGDFRGEHNDALRTIIGRQGIGFRFTPQGHKLPSGRVSNLGHSCDSPTRFKRKGKQTSSTSTPDQPAATEFSDAELLAALT